MLRITTGTAKNRKLKTPKIPKFRAVQEVAKQAVFAVLAEKTSGATCLDLFAGSGNMGIEALSRGANWCDFVDEDGRATKAIEQNLKTTNLQQKAEVHQKEAVKFVADCPRTYDIIFADPFYSDHKHKFLMELLPETLNENGVVVFFHEEGIDMAKLLEKSVLQSVDSRRYGKSFVDFLVAGK
ncbi:16S rRNA (guanine(966)-N(2))-methyltransferase RsmD [candidate division WWE3 bacterium]|nr:16S rRNA (guanine(966)-N(2))-methyltransferase RsmD [candidate division WWE3 bacterium]